MWSISPIIRFMSLYCTEIFTLEQVFPLKKINALKDANQSCKSFRTIRGPCQVQHIINFYNNDVAITKTKTKTYFNFAIYALTANFRPCQKIHQHRDWNQKLMLADDVTVFDVRKFKLLMAKHLQSQKK